MLASRQLAPPLHISAWKLYDWAMKVIKCACIQQSLTTDTHFHQIVGVSSKSSHETWSKTKSYQLCITNVMI